MDSSLPGGVSHIELQCNYLISLSRDQSPVTSMHSSSSRSTSPVVCLGLSVTPSKLNVSCSNRTAIFRAYSRMIFSSGCVCNNVKHSKGFQSLLLVFCTDKSRIFQFSYGRSAFAEIHSNFNHMYFSRKL